MCFRFDLLAIANAPLRFDQKGKGTIVCIYDSPEEFKGVSLVVQLQPTAEKGVVLERPR